MKLAVAASSMLMVAMADYPTEPDMQAVFIQHNLHRCMHGMQPLRWSNDLAFQAQSWADQGNLVPSTEAVGENLLIGTNITGILAAENWYNEVKETNNGVVQTFDAKTGHYTQMIWNSTTQVGCGKQTLSPRTFWVCRYLPEGNIPGQFAANTGPVLDTADCAIPDLDQTEVTWAFGTEAGCSEAGKLKVKRRTNSLINVMGFAAEEYDLLAFSVFRSEAGFPIGSTEGKSPAYEFVQKSGNPKSDQTFLTVGVVQQEMSFKGRFADEDANLWIQATSQAGQFKLGHGSGQVGTTCKAGLYFVSAESQVV